MSGDTIITVVGNLTDDIELRKAGEASVARFRIASTPRFQDRSGAWKDGEPLFLTCVIWRDLAENTATSLQRGSRVIVTGKLEQRSYQTAEGEKRTVYELEVEDLGPSLRYATAQVARKTSGARPAAAAPAASAAPAAPATSVDLDPWGPAPTGAVAGGFEGETPF